LAQTITLIASTGVEDGFAIALVEHALVVYSPLEVATMQDVANTSTSEAPVVILEIRELLVQLSPTIMGVTNAPPSSSESGPITTMETGSMSAPAKPALVVDILENLILHMIDHFFFLITYCIKLVLLSVHFLSSCGHYSRITS